MSSRAKVVSPAWADRVQVNLGPVLPSFRFPTGAPLGAEISLGKTSAVSYDELVQRYALLAPVAPPHRRPPLTPRQLADTPRPKLLAGFG